MLPYCFGLSIAEGSHRLSTLGRMGGVCVNPEYGERVFQVAHPTSLQKESIISIMLLHIHQRTNTNTNGMKFHTVMSTRYIYLSGKKGIQPVSKFIQSLVFGCVRITLKLVNRKRKMNIFFWSAGEKSNNKAINGSGSGSCFVRHCDSLTSILTHAIRNRCTSHCSCPHQFHFE